MILKLPPHTSHLLQPMDLTVFKPLKLKFDELLIAWQRKKYGVRASKAVFSTSISQAWRQLNRTNIISGFKKAGIVPFSDKVIPDEKYDPEALETFRSAPTSSISQSSQSLSVQDACVQVNSSSAGGSFEKILLQHVKQNTVTTRAKRRKICSGAEIVTSSDAVQTLKNAKKAAKTPARKR